MALKAKEGIKLTGNVGQLTEQELDIIKSVEPESRAYLQNLMLQEQWTFSSERVELTEKLEHALKLKKP